MSELIKLPSLEALPEVASRVLSYLKESKFFIFKGEMGAGKTTLIKEMCKQLEIIDNISSPTYSIVNEYRSSNEEKIFHFDFYRIEDPAEVYDMGYEEYFYANAICFVEWPEKVDTLLPSELIEVNLKVVDDSRIVSIEFIPNR